MTLYFRLLLLFIKSFFKKRVEPKGPVISNFRVWPTDLDFLGHMTNSRYLNVMDAGRMDLLARAGLVKPLKERGWYPVVVEESIHFRRALRLFVEFQLKTEITGYDDRHVILRQTFLKQGKVVALGVVRARFLGPDKEKIAPARLIALTEDSDVPVLNIPQADQARYTHLQELMEEENGVVGAC